MLHRLHDKYPILQGDRIHTSTDHYTATNWCIFSKVSAESQIMHIKHSSLNKYRQEQSRLKKREKLCDAQIRTIKASMKQVIFSVSTFFFFFPDKRESSMHISLLCWTNKGLYLQRIRILCNTELESLLIYFHWIQAIQLIQWKEKGCYNVKITTETITSSRKEIQ